MQNSSASTLTPTLYAIKPSSQGIAQLIVNQFANKNCTITVSLYDLNQKEYDRKNISYERSKIKLVSGIPETDLWTLDHTFANKIVLLNTKQLDAAIKSAGIYLTSASDAKSLPKILASYTMPYALLQKFVLVFNFSDSASPRQNTELLVSCSHTNSYPDYWQNTGYVILGLRYVLAEVIKQLANAKLDNNDLDITINDINLEDITFEVDNNEEINDDSSVLKALQSCWGKIPYSSALNPLGKGYYISYDYMVTFARYVGDYLADTWKSLSGHTLDEATGTTDTSNSKKLYTTQNTDKMLQNLVTVAKQILGFKSSKTSTTGTHTSIAQAISSLTPDS